MRSGGFLRPFNPGWWGPLLASLQHYRAPAALAEINPDHCYRTFCLASPPAPPRPSVLERYGTVPHGGRRCNGQTAQTDSVQVGLNFHVLQISGTWEPNDDEGKAAWELYVELVTRIAVVPLGGEEGLLREACPACIRCSPPPVTSCAATARGSPSPGPRASTASASWP